MNEIKATLRYLRVAPRKVRAAATLIKGKPVREADMMLRFLNRAPAHPLRKLLRSAVANAKHNFGLDGDVLSVQSIRVDGGPILKRSMPRARGMASMIRKRTSHVTLILKEFSQKK